MEVSFVVVRVALGCEGLSYGAAWAERNLSASPVLFVEDTYLYVWA